MELDDFLKPKKVRCVNNENRRDLTKGKLYDVAGATYGRLKIRDDNGGISWHDMDFFELVIESAENPPQDMELTPEFEAVEPKFKVGDKVYLFGIDYIEEITKIIGANVYLAGADFDASVSIKEICRATPENHERLQATFPDIEFERPPKPLVGSDLCRAMLDKGWKYVPCYVNDGSDDEAINRKHYVSVKNETPRSGYNFSGTGANDWKYAVPIDPRTGEPLTEAVLDE